MSAFPCSFLAPIHYIEIIEAIQYLSIDENSPRNDLEKGLYVAMKSNISSKQESKKSDFTSIKSSSIEHSKPIYFNKKPCRNFRNGVCKFGKNCTFLHERCKDPACSEMPQDNCFFGHSVSSFKKQSSDEDA